MKTRVLAVMVCVMTVMNCNVTSAEANDESGVASVASTSTQLFFDDFTGTGLDTSRWSIFVDSNGQYHWPYVAGGLLHSQGYHTRIDSIPTFAPTVQSVTARARIRLAGDYHKFGFGVNPNERAGPIKGYFFDTLSRTDGSGGREGYVRAFAWSNPGDGSWVALLDKEILVPWNEFHEFAVERTPSEVIYSIDGQEVARVADAFAGALPVGVWNERWGLMQTDWVEVSQVGEPEWPEPDMVLVPGGTFQMGDSKGDGYSDELPVHTVTLSQFYMSKYEITNSQYCAYLNSALSQGLITVTSGVVYKAGSGTSYPYCDTSTSSSFSQIAFSTNIFTVHTKGGRNMSNDPMVQVSWYGSVAYCNWRSQQEGKEQCYDLSTWTCDFSKNGYHLPTEAQWEYAARGGLSGKRFPWGDTISHSQANYHADYPYSYDISPTRGLHPTWSADGIWPYTSPVGSFSANVYGLCDMAGNVWEWCNDWYGSYSSNPQTNPTGPTGSHRVNRGGCWDDGAPSSRVTFRGNYSFPRVRASGVGFRVASVSEPEREWSFVQISDTHIGWTERKCEPVPGAFPPRYRCRVVDARENLAAVVKKLKKEKIDFVIATGDLVDKGCGTCNPDPYTGDCLSVTCPSAFDDFRNAFIPVAKQGVKVYAITGNHDLSCGLGYLDKCDDDLRGICAASKLIGSPVEFLGNQSSFEWPEPRGITFVALDTGPSNCRGALTTEDIEFLENLDKDTPKIILTHHPAVAKVSDSTGWIHDVGCSVFGGWAIGGDYADDFLDYCDEEENNVNLVLSGHTHTSHEYNSTLESPTERPYYIQTGSVVTKSSDEYPVFRRIDVGSPPMVQAVTQLTAEDYNYISAKIYSPATLHVYDSNGNHTGYDPVTGLELGIPDSFHFSHYTIEGEDGNDVVLPEEVLIFDPCNNYIYEVVGKEKGTYGLTISLVVDNNETGAFDANAIPTLPGAVHQYLIDWDALSEGFAGVTLFIDREGDGDFEKTVVSDSVLTSDEFDTPSVVEVIVPEAGDAVQDGITLTAQATDIDGVDAVSFYVREPNDGNGVAIGQENLAGTFNPVTGKWECDFDTTVPPDGYYVVLAKAIDTYANEGWSEVVPFSIRNWAIITMLPATPNSKTGRTMPVKFSLRIAQAVDPAMPFVYNDELEIRIYDKAKPSVILQRSVFGSSSTNYRIDMTAEMYITNFKTGTKPATYVVEIWRPTKNFKVGSFTFKTVK